MGVPFLVLWASWCTTTKNGAAKRRRKRNNSQHLSGHSSVVGLSFILLAFLGCCVLFFFCPSLISWGSACCSSVRCVLFVVDARSLSVSLYWFRFFS